MFINNRIFILVAAAFMLLLYSCSDNPSSIGENLLKGDNLIIKQLDSFNDTLTQESSFSQRTLSLGGSYSLLVGKKDNVEASALINFLIPIADSVKNSILADSISVVGANIQLIVNYPTKENNASFDLTVHKIQSGWTPLHYTADSLSMLSYDPADISSNKSLNDSVAQFDISNDFAFSMLKYAADSIGTNFGLYIKPTDNSQKVVGYYSSYNGIDIPQLTIAIQRLGASSQDTLIFYASSDVSVVTGSIPPTNLKSRIIVQGGLVVNSRLWFDVSRIPFNAIINDAEVTLNMDASETYLGDTTNSVLAAFLTDSSAFVVDSATNIITFSRENNSMNGTITSYVQRWVNSRVNEGMLLFPRNEAGSVDLLTFIGSNAADSLKPRLHIIYTLKP